MNKFQQLNPARLLRLLCLTLLATAFAASADIPNAYYNSAIGKKEAALKNALNQIIYNHTEVSSYMALPEYFKRTDVYPEGHEKYGQWWDMYGNVPLYLPNWSGALMNREHSFPKSWWGGGTDTPAYVDLFHLYPAEAEANQEKLHYPLGEVQTATFDNGMSKVGYAVSGQGGGAAKVFEPADEYKGDFARTYFYFVTCYQNLTFKYTYMVNNNTYPTFNQWSINLLLKWNEEDPVSQKEIDRNEAVYRIQANRNPFIDYPELAEYLWGSKKGQSWNPNNSGSDTPAGDPQLITPVQNMALDFGETVVGNSSVSSLFFHGIDLTGSLTLTVTGAKRDLFKIEPTSLSASTVNSDSGYWLRVTYTPTEIADSDSEDEARLIVSDGGLEGSLGVSLRGRGVAVPVLHDFKALAATNVTSTSYTARWEEPMYGNPAIADVVDYYVVTRTVFDNGNASSEDLEAETNELHITDCTPGSRESYYVRSARLGYFSAPSNTITVDLGSDGLSDITNDNPLGWAYYPGGLRFVCAFPHTGCRIYDASGRQVKMIPEIENNTIIELPLGAFFIVTDQQSTPLRVLVRS
jgi:endonuclease I